MTPAAIAICALLGAASLWAWASWALCSVAKDESA